VGQKGVLLGLVEPVNFIDEKNGLFAVAVKLGSRFFDHGPDFFHTREDGGKGFKVGLRFRRRQSGQGCLSRTGGAPEDHGEEMVAAQGLAQKAVFPHQVGLSHEIVE
jgi:hypothetical protein